jgi:hypothetical protein
VGLAAFLPVLGGGILLDQVVVEGRLPVVGSIKTGSALVFDLGVTLIVVGLVSTVLLALRADELAGTEEGP